jgi:molybdopterin-guanine dinucleotide biosynthesis protein A
VVSAAILNGGRAARFGGRDKGALVAGGRMIREHQLAVLASLSEDIMLVGGDGAGPFPVPLRVVADRQWGRGPLAGLEAALIEARGDVVVVVACDMPGITVRFLSDLLSRIEQVDAVVPRTESGYHPLCAVYRRTCLPVVSRRLSEGRLTMKGIFDDVRVSEVSGAELSASGDPTRLLANVNTPADYDEITGLLNHEPSI